MTSPRASILLRASPHYGQTEFAAGFKRYGITPIMQYQPPASEQDVLVIWNRNPKDERYAKAYEEIGATVLVVENAWIGNASKQGHRFSICKGHHNGAGEWSVGAGDRWSELGIELEPWREDGDHILVLPQRGIGEPGIAMEKGWIEATVARLKAKSDRPIRIRAHPGAGKWDSSMRGDLAGAWAAVTWASGAGVKALVAGIPVFYEMPNWICAKAAAYGIAGLEHPYLGDRFPTMNRLAWAQWSPEEITEGTPFQWLLAE